MLPVTSDQYQGEVPVSCVPACEVHFENTRVPVENVLGEVGGGFKVRGPAGGVPSCVQLQAPASCPLPTR